MFASFAILVLWILLSLRIRSSEDLSGYISKETCDSVKGIFIVYVLLCHAWPYLRNHGYDFSTGCDCLFMYAFRGISQLCVVMFFFYSGFGIAESVRVKGQSYIGNMPRHRLLGTLLNFDVAVMVFLLVDWLIGIKIGPLQALLSLVCWDSVGNSNWYIFVIVLCYLVSCVAYVVIRSEKIAAWVIFFAIDVAVIGLSYVRPVHWYSTMSAYGAGVLFSAYRPWVERIIRRFYIPLLLALLLIVYLLPNAQHIRHGVVYNIKSVAFAFTVVLLSMRIMIKGAVFSWCGRHLFSMYIYQRIPMLLLVKFLPAGFLCIAGGLPFVALSLILTLIISRFYHLWTIKI